MVERIIDGIKVAVWLIVIVGWTVIGLFFWIPFMARMIAQFSAAIVVATYTGTSYATAEVGLRHSITFYPEGFRLINTLLRREAEPDGRTPMGMPGFVRAAIEAWYGLAFWGLLAIAGMRYAGMWRGSRLARLVDSPPVADTALARAITQAGVPTPLGGAKSSSTGQTKGLSGSRPQKAPPTGGP